MTIKKQPFKTLTTDELKQVRGGSLVVGASIVMGMVLYNYLAGKATESARKDPSQWFAFTFK